MYRVHDGSFRSGAHYIYDAPGPIKILKIFGGTLFRLRFAIVAMTCMLGLGYVTRYSGMDAVLGLAFTRTGWFFPFFGAFSITSPEELHTYDSDALTNFRTMPQAILLPSSTAEVQFHLLVPASEL